MKSVAHWKCTASKCDYVAISSVGFLVFALYIGISSSSLSSYIVPLNHNGISNLLHIILFNISSSRGNSNVYGLLSFCFFGQFMNLDLQGNKAFFRKIDK